MQDINAVAHGHILLFISDHFFNTDQGRQAFIEMFLQEVETNQKVCSIGFNRIEVRTGGGNSRTGRLPCSS